MVVGGGFAGATCARTLKRLEPKLAVTLVETDSVFTAYPLSNEVLVGERYLLQQQFGYDHLMSEGVTFTRAGATAVDPSARTVALGDGTKLAYDRLVLAPGVDLNWSALPGYSEAASEKMPHAWKGDVQIGLLGRQLEAMNDGGVVGIAIPANPTRCPPAVYERASLIAHYLKAKKPRSKLLLLDAKDAFSMQRQFEKAWARLYPGLIERVPLSQGGNVTSVDASTMTLVTDFGDHRVAVANVIPPQKAAAIAGAAGVADRTGWCVVEPATFESTLQANIHVLGDAALMGGMAKSAFAANAQAKVCAAAIVARLAGRELQEPRLTNTCYSLVAPDYGISVTGVYHPEKGQLVEVAGSAGSTPLDADDKSHAREAADARRWFGAITGEIFG